MLVNYLIFGLFFTIGIDLILKKDSKERLNFKDIWVIILFFPFFILNFIYLKFLKK